MFGNINLDAAFIHFPIISMGELIQWQKNNKQAIELANRISDQHQQLQQDARDLLDFDAVAIKSRLLLSSDWPEEKPINFYTLLIQLAESSDDESLLRILTEYWVKYLTDCLALEENPLPLLMHLGNNLDAPVQFSALLIVLCGRENIDVESIVYSGLLHRFFMMKCVAMEEIEKTYLLISFFADIHTDQGKKIKALLAMANTCRGIFKKDAMAEDQAVIRGFEVYALDASQSSSSEELIQISETVNVFNFTSSPENWNRLLKLFDTSLFIAALQNDCHASWVSEKLNALSSENLLKLFKELVTQVAREIKLDVLQRFTSALNAANINVLFSVPNPSTFLLLIGHPSLMEIITNKNEWSHTVPIKEITIAQIFVLGEHSPYFFSIEIREVLYKRAFDALCTIFEDATQKNVAEKIMQKNYIKQIDSSQILTLCQEKMQEIIEPIKKILTETPFTSEQYITICAMYEEKEALRELLITLSSEPLIYLQGDDGLQVLVMEQLVADEHFNLESCLNIMHANHEPLEQYDTLYACLSLSSNKDLILLTINHLNKCNIDKIIILNCAIRNLQAFELLIDTYRNDKAEYEALYQELNMQNADSDSILSIILSDSALFELWLGVYF